MDYTSLAVTDLIFKSFDSFDSLAVQVLEFEVKPLKFKKMFFALDAAFSIKRTRFKSLIIFITLLFYALNNMF